MVDSSQALALHKKLNGKIEVRSKVTLDTKSVLSLAYTPGVAQASMAIKNHPESVYQLTIKKNTVAVVSDGSAVLGLGNIGARAAIPVMEGKCAIFKEFAGIDAFPICIETQNTEEIISIIKNISPVFGGINIEDISAPRCFEIENRLQDLGIPVMHDDQHATSIIVMAALINALKIVSKKIADIKIVLSGSGAAGIATVKLLSKLSPKDILVVDRTGIISAKRSDLNPCKKELLAITNHDNISGGLIDAAKNADVMIGLSSKGLFTKDIITSLNHDPIIFAMANPNPEVTPQDAKSWGVEIIGTGRSDYPNQINNSLVFPGFFKGLLKYRINKITTEMKLAAAYALSDLVKNPTSENFVPTMFDKRVVPTLVAAIKKFA